SEQGVLVSDNFCNNGLWSVDIQPDETQIGEYLLTYSAEDCEGNPSNTITRLVQVVDLEAPQISLSGPASLTIERWTPYNEPGVSITDNYYDESTLQGLLQETGNLDVDWLGLYSICYQVTDPSGNLSNQVCRTINVVANATSVEEGFAQNLKVYPNPSR